jgi:pyruvate formate lyase activating enzyme
LGGRLQPILDSLRMIHAMGFWLEVVTLVVPEFNSSDQELTSMAEFLAGISPDIPWHVTAFHKNYKMTGPRNTPPEMLKRAAELGRRAGLRHVYAGNLPGRVDGLEDTRCHQCGTLLVERCGYRIESYRVSEDSACPRCHTPVPGRWRPPKARLTASQGDSFTTLA